MSDILHIKISCNCGDTIHHKLEILDNKRVREHEFFKRILIVEKARIDNLYQTRASDEFIRGSNSVIERLLLKI